MGVATVLKRVLKKNRESGATFASGFRQQINDLSAQFSDAMQAIETPYDVKATLICSRKIGSESEWDISLSNIYGRKVQYLFGHFFEANESLSLEEILPLHLHEMHRIKVNSILNQGCESPYWPLLFNTMVKRTIKIVTADDKRPRLVKILMELDPSSSINREHYIFDVTFFDETIQNIVAEKAGSITHDMRGLLAACASIEEPFDTLSSEQFSALSESEKDQVFKRHREAVDSRKEILKACLDLCKPSRSDFTARAIMEDNQSNYHALQPLDQLTAFLTTQHLQRQVEQGHECIITCPDTPQISLEKNKIDALKRFLLNLIKNAIEALATEISIQFTEEAELLVCQVSDNGKGMPTELANNFFSRTLPYHRTETTDESITGNRHEGTLLAYEAWRHLGGQATVVSAKPAQFRLSIAKHHHFFSHTPKPTSNYALSNEQLEKLKHFFDVSTRKYTFLLVDDTVLHLKFLTRKIQQFLSIKTHDSDVLKQKINWSGDEILLDMIGFCGVIYASNGRVALEVIKQAYPITALVTDKSMPHLNGIELLKETGKLQTPRSHKMLLALHLGDNLSDLDAEEQMVLDDLNVLCIPKGNSVQIQQFLSTVFSPPKGILDTNANRPKTRVWHKCGI